MQFAEGRPAKSTDRIVYVAGAFDLFHIGHLAFLEEAAKHGDYVIVGIHTDQVVNHYKGQNYPIMTLHERVLSVLACRVSTRLILAVVGVLEPLPSSGLELSHVLPLACLSPLPRPPIWEFRAWVTKHC